MQKGRQKHLQVLNMLKVSKSRMGDHKKETSQTFVVKLDVLQLIRKQFVDFDILLICGHNIGH
jgi:hypothetical protein